MSEKMRAVRLYAPGDVRCVEVDIPAIEKVNDVIVKVKSCGVCGSDIPKVMVKGAYHYPITIGHEFAGKVISVGSDVKSLLPGDRITVMPLLNCGKCDYCKIGQAVMCDDYDYYGSRTDGAMAEYVRVRAENCLLLPPKVDYEMGSMTDPASVALHAIRKAGIEPGQKAAIYGLGAIGYLAVQWLKAIGCKTVLVVDLFDDKLKLAETLGADYCINAKEQDAVKKILEFTDGKGADVVIELAGSKITQVQAIQSARKGGKVVFCGISYDDLTIPNSALQNILRGELQLIGSWNSSIAPLPINEWQSALDFMQKGLIDTKSLVTHRYKLEDCQKAFDMMYKRMEVFTKVLFKPEEMQKQ